MLAGAWRARQPALDLSTHQLNLITPLLLENGTAALAWRRLQDTKLEQTRSAISLKQAYRLFTIQSALFESHIEKASAISNASGVDPVLIKGWACARSYDEPGLRPYGDIDLCILQSQMEILKEALTALPQSHEIDLHSGIPPVYGRNFSELYSCSQLVPLGSGFVRIPCAEDHLRILCIHLLRHGAWRPLWLCDIAVTVEALPTDFDWGYCVGKGSVQADWIACALVLAQELLGADLSKVPDEVKSRALPKWMVPAVLAQWAVPFSKHTSRAVPMKLKLLAPRSTWSALRKRWPNPIEATVSMQAKFTEFPRLPFQLGNCVVRTAGFLARAAT
jgi:hypothetical protein